MDHLSPQQRHDNMAAIRSKDTKPEMVVRHWLWRQGFRYSLNSKRLPGHPDIVLRKWKTCVFVNGCFWHGHLARLLPNESSEFRVESSESVSKFKEFKSLMLQGSACCRIPETNREFWVKKIRRNMERDAEVSAQLEAMGWRCITVWECELKPKRREETLERLAAMLRAETAGPTVKTYCLPEEGEERKVADEGEGGMVKVESSEFRV